MEPTDVILLKGNGKGYWQNSVGRVNRLEIFLTTLSFLGALDANCCHNRALLLTIGNWQYAGQREQGEV